MNNAYSIEPDRKEIARYLGYRGHSPDERVAAQIEKCVRTLQGAVSPGFVRAELDLTIRSRESLSFADVTVHSANLAKNLRGCRKIILFAATLGIGPDRLIARSAVTSASEMVILQAASAAMIEAYCDMHNDLIREAAAEEGLYCRPRFSPGYGDFSLTHQEDLLRLLQASKKIGITLTESLLMIPSKSVTGVIGLSEEKVPCPPAGCEICSKRDCAYRRSPQEVRKVPD